LKKRSLLPGDLVTCRSINGWNLKLFTGANLVGRSNPLVGQMKGSDVALIIARDEEHFEFFIVDFNRNIGLDRRELRVQGKRKMIIREKEVT